MGKYDSGEQRPSKRPGTYQIARSGEYYVAAELSRRGFNATTFAGNLPLFDIVAVTPSGKALRIQVKTRTNKNNRWQLKRSEGCEDPTPDMFWVLVHLRNEEQPRYWVIPDKKMRAIIRRDYESRSDKFKANQNWQTLRKELVEGWEDKWCLLDAAVRPDDDLSV